MPTFGRMKRPEIEGFEGPFVSFNNFYISPFQGEDDEIEYLTVEHYYQAHKTNDLEERKRIASLKSAAEAHDEGQKIDPGPSWDKRKETVMLDGLRLKFFSNYSLAQGLVNTKNAILTSTNNYHDNYWGKCKCFHCRNKVHHNKLGGLLMILREQLGGKYE